MPRFDSQSVTVSLPIGGTAQLLRANPKRVTLIVSAINNTNTNQQLGVFTDTGAGLSYVALLLPEHKTMVYRDYGPLIQAAQIVYLSGSPGTCDVTMTEVFQVPEI